MSEDEKINGRLDEIEERLNKRFDEQGDDLSRLVRAVFGDEDTPTDEKGRGLAMKTKVDDLYSAYEQAMALKKVGYGLLALMTGGAGAAIWTFLTGMVGGGA